VGTLLSVFTGQCNDASWCVLHLGHLEARSQGVSIAGDLLLANTQWRSLSTIVAVDPKSGRASRLSPRDEAAWTLLENNNGWLVAVRSRPSQPPALHVTRAQQPQRLDNESPETLPLQWDLLAAADHVGFDPKVEAALQDITVDTLQVCPAASKRLAAPENIVLSHCAKACIPSQLQPGRGQPSSAWAMLWFDSCCSWNQHIKKAAAVTSASRRWW
jgi:hypothetical protein